MDTKAAYDTVDRRILWNKLIERVASPLLLASVKALFEGNESVVAVQGHQSGRLEHKVSVLQGPILSPVLYALFIDDLAARLATNTKPRLADAKVR